MTQPNSTSPDSTSRGASEFDVSVIVPSYNSTEELRRCISSLMEQKTSCGYEVIVVDSSDKAEEVAALSNLPPSVQVVRLGKRTYPGVARNVGVVHAKGQIVAFTDSDCVVDEGWVERIHQVHKNGDRLLVGGGVANGTPRHIVGTAEYLLEFGEFIPSSGKREVENIPTCNFSLAKELFEEIGGFDDVIKGSDTLFSYKVRERGYKVLFLPDIVVHHVNRRNLRRFLKNQIDLGKGAYDIRKQYDFIPGQFLTRHPVLALLILPYRTFTYFRKAWKAGGKHLAISVLTFPLSFVGLVCFVLGFLKGFSAKDGR